MRPYQNNPTNSYRCANVGANTNTHNNYQARSASTEATPVPAQDYNHVLINLQDYMLHSKVLDNSTKHKLTSLSAEKMKKNEVGQIIVSRKTGTKQNEPKFSNYIPKEEAEEISNKVEESVPESVPVPVVQVVDNTFHPKEKDALFWCYYIIKNGYNAYAYPNTTSYINEKNEKFKCIQLLRDNKDLLKTKKIKNLKEDVEDDLANKDRIGMKTFIALCIVSKINIVYIHKRKCFEHMHNEEEPVHVVHSSNEYCGELNISKEQLHTYRTTLFKWESVDKPLKAVSSYKSEELLDLCIKLVFDNDSDTEYSTNVPYSGSATTPSVPLHPLNATNKQNLKKKTKKELYELLVQNL
uniref:Uncharacterized protein n=1 Tax=viral metagenome TaxID=1070528 RepID=A0A6C0EWQ4_9ZZZZ